MGSLEETIRKVQQKYKNRPSPLALLQMNQNPGFVPTQVPDQMRSKNPRDMLTRGFVPPNDTFRNSRVF